METILYALYASVWETFWKSYVYGIGGFAAGICILLVLRYFGWLARKHILLKIWVALYYIHVPVNMGLCCWGYMSVLTVENKIYKSIEKVSEEAKKELYPSLAEFMDKNAAQFIKENHVLTNSEIVDKFFQHTKVKKDAMYTHILHFCLTKVLDYGIGTEEKDRDQRISAINKGISEKMLDTAFKKMNQLIMRQVILLFVPYHIFIGVYFMVAMMIPAIEIIAVNYFKQEHKNKVQEDNHPDIL